MRSDLISLARQTYSTMGLEWICALGHAKTKFSYAIQVVVQWIESAKLTNSSVIFPKLFMETVFDTVRTIVTLDQF